MRRLPARAARQRQKKIRGTIYYFGNWARRVEGILVRVEGDGAKEAEAAYNRVREDLHAGRTPRTSADGLTMKDLCNRFLTAKLRKIEAGGDGAAAVPQPTRRSPPSSSPRSERTDLVDGLAADDFAHLRAAMVKKWGRSTWAMASPA